MNFFFFILPLLCSATSLLDVKNISAVNTTSLISSLADANPDDVREVRDLVDELISAGEHDRAVATASRDTAQGVRDDAQTALTDATTAHTQVAGELVTAEQEVSRLELLEASKRQAKEDSSDAKDDALEALTASQDHLDTETDRLDEERVTLERILELLDTLLPSDIGSCSKAITKVEYGNGHCIHGLRFTYDDGSTQKWCNGNQDSSWCPEVNKAFNLNEGEVLTRLVAYDFDGDQGYGGGDCVLTEPRTQYVAAKIDLETSNNRGASFNDAGVDYVHLYELHDPNGICGDLTSSGYKLVEATKG